MSEYNDDPEKLYAFLDGKTWASQWYNENKDIWDKDVEEMTIDMLMDIAKERYPTNITVFMEGVRNGLSEGKNSRTDEAVRRQSFFELKK